MKRYYLRIKNWIQTQRKTLIPGPLAFKGARLGLLIFAIGSFLLAGAITWGRINDPFFLTLILGILLASFLGSRLFSYVFYQFIKLPKTYRWASMASIPLLLVSTAFSEKLLFIALIILPLLGASIAVIAKKNFKEKPLPHRIIAIVGLLIGLSGIGAGIYFMSPTGFELERPVNAAWETELNIPEVEDPSQPGPYEVKTLFYGSGEDPHRAFFGEKVDLKSPRVDGTAFIDEWEGISGWYRTWYWGFDYRELPLNAQVWYPEGKGPFPLVLIVHGNHPMSDYSDEGYGYLGELMASKGYIFASVDENFLNGSWSDIFGSLKKENDARAWILLEHLKLWHAWDEEAEHPFFGKVDTDNIALIGHSRGGEAMGHAAAFNQLSAYPDDASISFDYQFNIRSVIAIAPVDGQYQPGNTRTYFKNVNYFVIHGAQDADVTSYSGARQYERISFTDSLHHVKAGLYVDGANHGQFNTSWGNNDRGIPFTRLLNLKQLMPAKDQEKVAQVFISAFLDATLKGKSEYLPLFTDARKARSYLPETIYLSQFEDSKTQYITRFDEDLDIKSTPSGSRKIRGEHLTVWKEANIKLKYGVKDTRGVYLGWQRDEENPDTARYSIKLPLDSLYIDSNSVLVFSLAHAKGSTNPKSKGKWIKNEDEAKEDKEGQADEEMEEEGEDEEEELSEEEKKEKARMPIDFRIELQDTSGEIIRFPISDFSYLQRLIKVKIMKDDFLGGDEESESVFQTFPFALRDYQVQNPRFDMTRIDSLHFVFDRTEKGLIILDNIGFTVKPD